MRNIKFLSTVALVALLSTTLAMFYFPGSAVARVDANYCIIPPATQADIDAFNNQLLADLSSGNSAALITDFVSAYHVPDDCYVTLDVDFYPVDTSNYILVDNNYTNAISPSASEVCFGVMIVVSVMMYGAVIVLVYRSCKKSSTTGTNQVPIQTNWIYGPTNFLMAY